MSINNPRRLLAAAAPKQGPVADENSAFMDAVMSSSSSQGKPKRQTVKAACANCQKRKVKCSGERPMCALCQARGQACTYDAEAGLTRIEALRRRNKDLVEQNTDYELILHALRTGSEEDALSQLSRLRAASDVESYAEHLKQSKAASKRRKSTIQISPQETTLSLSISHGSSQEYDTNMTASAPTSSHSASRPPPVFTQKMRPPATQPVMSTEILQPPQPQLAHPYGTASFAETWPFQNATNSFPDAAPSNESMHVPPFNSQAPGPPASEIISQDWNTRYDGSRQVIDPILDGAPVAHAFASGSVSQVHPPVDGDNLHWPPWDYWAQPPHGQLQ